MTSARTIGWVLFVGQLWWAVAPVLAQTQEPTIHAVVIAGGRLIIGGDFTLASGRQNLAAIDLETGAVDAAWRADVDEPVHALETSADGREIYVGGSFSRIRDASRSRLAAVSAATGEVTAWAPRVDGPVHALARSGDGRTLYAGGNFSRVDDLPRDHLASLATRSVGDPVLPWVPAVDGPVRQLVLDEERGRLYAGGDFGRARSEVRRGLAAFTLASGRILDWDAGLEAGARVLALHLQGDEVWVGGDFRRDGSAHLLVLDAASGAVRVPLPGPDGPVRALAVDDEGSRVYVGGDFSRVGDQPRRWLAGLRRETTGLGLMAWDPGADAAVSRIETLVHEPASSRLHIGGALVRLAGQDLGRPLASLGVALPVTESNLPGGAYREGGHAELDCRPGDAACLHVCWRTDGETPVAPADCAAGPVTVAFGDTTVRFFSEDVDGGREVIQTARYVVDRVPPEVVASLPSGLYGAADEPRVELACEDDQPAFGCTIHYTVDNTAPDPESRQYEGPIALAGFFPDPLIPPEAVDPLRHLAGSVTLRAIAVDAAGNVSEPLVRRYDIDLAPPRVRAEPPSGNHLGPLTVVLGCDDGTGSGCAGVYYRTDGGRPVLGEDGAPVPPALRYEGPFVLHAGAVVRALARDEAGNEAESPVATYAVTEPGADADSGVGAVGPGWLIILGAAGLAARRRGTGASGGSAASR